MNREQTLEKLRKLRLSTMADCFEERIQRNDHQSMTPEEFFCALIDDEAEARASKRIRGLLGRSNLRPEKACLENIRYEKKRGFVKADLQRFIGKDWLTKSENMVFTGATGTGKTYLAEALVFQACRMGYRGEKYSLDALLEEIRVQRALGQYAKWLKRTLKVTVLVIDDFAIASHTQQQYCELLHLLEERTSRSITIITSQYPLEKWHERIGDPTLADAICDRLIMGAWNLQLKGPSQRGKAA